MSGAYVKPCVKCGAEDRYQTGKCKPCARASAAKWNAENTERKKEQNAIWRSENPERKKGQSAIWRSENPEYNAKWYAENSERNRDRKAKWRSENPELAKERDTKNYNKHRLVINLQQLDAMFLELGQ